MVRRSVLEFRVEVLKTLPGTFLLRRGVGDVLYTTHLNHPSTFAEETDFQKSFFCPGEEVDTTHKFPYFVLVSFSSSTEVGVLTSTEIHLQLLIRLRSRLKKFYTINFNNNFRTLHAL